jgi:alkylation response protein AidB-like acyl-CoA dehydrogenase
MTEVRRLLSDTVTRLFGDGVTPERLAEAERGAWLGDLWATARDTGLLSAHLGEAAGGAGATWEEAAVVAHACGRFAVPLPIVEAMLAGWLLEQAGIPVPDGGILTIAPAALASDALGARGGAVTLARVPWGRHATHVVATAPAAPGLRVAVFARDAAAITPGHDVALEPRDTLTFAALRGATADAVLHPDTVQLAGAMLRAAQMAGALDTLLDLSVAYATERVQFGRPIGQFQAIQQDLARLAGLTAAAGVAAAAAARAASERSLRHDAPDGPAFEIAAAKVVVGEAAEHGPRIAHQVHGAIGFTYEHRLHFYTRRLWAWRAEFGTPETWAARLGATVLAAGAEGLWPLVTER